MSRRTRRKGGWRTIAPDPLTVGPILRQAGFVGSKADPIIVRASFDADDRPRRVHARYADGWTCTMHLARDGSFSLTQAIRLRTVGRRPVTPVSTDATGG